MCITFASAFFFSLRFLPLLWHKSVWMDSVSTMFLAILAAITLPSLFPLSTEGLTSLRKIQNIALPVANGGFGNFTSVTMPSTVACWLHCQKDEYCQACSYDDSTQNCCLFQSLSYEQGSQVTQCPSKVIGAVQSLSRCLGWSIPFWQSVTDESSKYRWTGNGTAWIWRPHSELQVRHETDM